MKQLLLLFVIFMGVEHCYAQKSQWTFGLKAGIGSSGRNKVSYPDSEVSDTYKTGTSYGFGIWGGYRFLKYFTATVDVEWQQVLDERVRTATFNSPGTGQVVNTVRFENVFQRVQVPVAIQFSPFTKTIKPYVKVGIIPNRLLNGSFDNEFRSSESATVDFDKADADFDMEPNKNLDRQLNFFAGIGVGMGKHLSVEFVHFFAERLKYASAYSFNTFVLYPDYYSYALRGTQFSLVYHIL
ncbi:outer membrane beta-barrel protein [Dyadobacter sp. BHUBP1]|uniref:outer membrane beta-barrel protein n=1 Tax=Dyadobacter sp. BHUBP1 TaxID=3424178 RepID=UPI003D331EC0